MRVAILNGPNLNLTGKREPSVYGSFTLEDVERSLQERINESGKEIQLLSFQSNHEGALIDFIHNSVVEKIDYIIFNPGAYAHTSIALHDAIKAVNARVIEVHISNIHAREQFRHHSYIAPATIGQVVGLGLMSYKLALEYVLNIV